ncbi:MAG: NAD-dependent epimerase/dehydratase family protein [Bacteroidota bacterium]
MFDTSGGKKTLVIGAMGQIGQELLEALYLQKGTEAVIAADIRAPKTPLEGKFAELNVMERDALIDLIKSHEVGEVYNLAAILSAKGEQHPELAWDLNMTGLLNCLEAARQTGLEKVFWPSSIAVFGPSSPQAHTPQYCSMDPNTVYGISKLAGERWCEYYAARYGVDVRSLRYPGLISYKAAPGGGTTDYAVDIFHQALQHGRYTSFLDAHSRLPMLYMKDALQATIQLMSVPRERLRIRSSYNLNGLSFTPAELTQAIQVFMPALEVSYAPDFRQHIANSWPDSIDDRYAREDWGWRPSYSLEEMTREMLGNLAPTYGVNLMTEKAGTS